MSFYSFARKAFGPLMRFIFNTHVHGLENIPAEGGLLICPNHISAPDVIMLTAVVPHRQIRYMAKAELFKIPVLSGLIKALGAFPIKRGEGDVGAIKKTITMLKEGETVGLFPQGTRYRGVHPSNSTVKHGAGMIAYRANVPVLPVAIITKGYKVALFKRVDIIFGTPIYPNEFGFESGNRDEQIKATEKIFDEILKLHDKGVSDK